MDFAFDTNIFIADPYLQGEGFQTLLRSRSALSLRLYIPVLVLEEVVAKYRDNLDKECGKLRGQTDSVRKWLPDLAYVPLPTVADATKLYEDWLRRRLKALGAKLLPLPDVTHEEVIRRILERKKPFNDKGAGYRDFLIWRSILPFVRPGKLVFVSNNVNDFADESKKSLHPDLLADLPRGREVMFYPSLRQAVDAEVLPHMKVLETVRRKIGDGTYPGFKLIDWVRGAEFYNHVVAAPVPPSLYAFEAYPVEKILITNIHPLNWRVEDVRQLEGASVHVKGLVDGDLFMLLYEPRPSREEHLIVTTVRIHFNIVLTDGSYQSSVTIASPPVE
jgi:hypothetical protein